MRLTAVMLWALAGCGAGDAKSFVDGSGSSNDAAASAEDGGGGPSQDESEPSVWELGGVLHIESGLLAEDETLMQVRLLDEDREVLCSEDVVVDTATTWQTSQFPDESLLGWWRVEIAAPVSPSCFVDDYDFPVPDVVFLGIGAMDPEVEAVAGSDPTLDVIDSLNAAYASLDQGGTVWVFGVVGTASAFAGDGDALTEGPVEDGDWTIEPLYPFPL